jgi:hypothetical protein
MIPRPRPTLALALATASALAAPTPGPAVAGAEEPVAEHCHTWALSPEEVAAGEYSEVFCYPVGEEPPARRSADIALATVYTATGGLGTPMTVWRASCTGGSIAFAPGSAWDNVISSTELLACGNAKHWENSNNTGANQLVSTTGSPVNMVAGMDNRTSSIQYAP